MNDKLAVFKRINGNTLKVIACVIMLIDHMTAGIVIPVVRCGLYPDSVPYEKIELVYEVLRAIGRNSFPIFCFLIVEGFIHTTSRRRYALGLFVFGLISEPFFDGILNAEEEFFNPDLFEVLRVNRPFLNEQCNVFFTLLLGLIAIWMIERIFNTDLSFEIRAALSLLSCGCIIFIAELIHSDYHGFGVGLIIVFYLLRMYEPLNLMAGYFLLSLIEREFFSFPSFVLLLFYNKKQGRKLGLFKYLFYAFYPVHIFGIYMLRCMLYG